MSNNKSIQYINLIKIEQNIRIDNQVFINGKLLTAAQFIFLLENNNLSVDTLSKIKTLDNGVNNSFITAICEAKTQKIIKNSEIKDKNDVTLLFDSFHSIILNKADIDFAKAHLNDGNIDYFISPFTILHDEIMLNPQANSLNLFILNNSIYAIFLNSKKQFGYSSINSLTPYFDIEKSNFYKDKIAEQTLYDEIYLLELEETIHTILKKYYETIQPSNFCETVNIFYVIKHLENQQIESLKTNLALDVVYTPISIDDTVDSIARRKNIEYYSFSKKRVKRSKFSILVWFLLTLLVATSVLYGFYYFQSSNKTITEVLSSTYKQKIEQEIDLPNHISTNRSTIELITNIFNTIDDDSLLKEIQIAQNESIIIYDTKTINPFEKILKPKLLQFYEHSERTFTTEKNGVFTSIISNINLLTKPKIVTKRYIPINQERFLSAQDGKKGIEQLFHNNAVVKLVGSKEKKIIQYEYDVSTTLQTPIEFFNIIKLLEKQYYSIILDYPVEFSKTKQGLDIKFKLFINQNKPLSLTK